MFENNPYKLPEDKFKYIQYRMNDLNISATVESCDHNPFLQMQHHQLFLDQQNDGLLSSNNSFQHYKLCLARHDVVRDIFFSVDNHMVDKKYLSFSQNVDQKGLYQLTTLCWSMFACQWRHIIQDELYLWAESMGYSSRLDTDYDHLFSRFEYDKHNLTAFIDIFGEDVFEDIMDNFKICNCCEQTLREGVE